MIADDPTQRAEAQLLGQILLDEEQRAAGETGDPRLLEQVRSWGITSSGLFSRPYHQDVWRRIQTIAQEGGAATRQTVGAQLREDTQEPTETAPSDTDAVHPDTAHPVYLCELTDAAESQHRPDRCAAIVVDAAMHRSTHDLSVELDRATRGDPGSVRQAVDKAKTTLGRMREAWQRLPEQARHDVEAARPKREQPIAEAHAELQQARSMMAELRRDPAYAAQVAADPAWTVMDKVANVLDAMANTSIDAPRSPDPGDSRVFLTPGQMIAGGNSWVEYYRQQRDAEAAEDERDHRRGLVSPSEDQIAFADSDAAEATANTQRQAERGDRESRLLGSLLADPTQLDELPLDPSDITNPACRQVLQLMTELRDSGVEVDRAIVDWSLQARGHPEVAEAIGEPITAREATSGLARHIAEDAQADRVRCAVTTLRELGIDPAAAPEDLITTAETSLEAVGASPPELHETLGERHAPEAEQQAPGPEQAEGQEIAAAEPEEATAPAPRQAPAPAEAQPYEQRLARQEEAELERRAAQRNVPDLDSATPAIAR